MKTFVKFLFSLVLLVFFVKPVSSSDQFIVDSNVEYKVEESGRTHITHEISLENAFSTLYATSYTLALENVDAANISAYYEDGTKLLTEVSDEGDTKTIKISFPDAVVGKGKIRKFFIAYDNSTFAVRTGEVWEISIPKLAQEDAFRSYTATLKVPSSLGFEAYISPRPIESSVSESVMTYKFDKSDLTKTGVSAGFGQFQVFNFTLNYHLENPLPRKAETEIALPPDTAFQKVYIRSLVPEPTTVKIDPDGNWLAVYELEARGRVDVVASGEVQIFSSERSFPKPNPEVLSKNLMESSVWQVNDAEIGQLAQELKTPKAIYDYVSTHLKYNYDRVRPNVDRLGAKAALQNPEGAICMEFTDLFIAIARAAGIPAREVNGYAYTENPDLQPLGLVADVLHSWPEYWDEKRGAWIPIDPTWASTTGGVDFFNKLDLRHFAFVIHGEDDTKPYPPGSYKLGSNPQKDVFVSFGKLNPENTHYPDISAEFKQNLPFFNSTLNIKIKNPGPSSFYSLYPTVLFDQTEFSRDFIEAIPPFGSYETTIKVPYSFLGKNTPSVIKIEAGGSEIEVPTNKRGILVTSLLVLFIGFIILVIGLIIRMKWTKVLSRTHQRIRVYISSKLKRNQSTSEKL